MSLRTVPIEAVPPRTVCIHCRHSETEFPQPFVVLEEGTEREEWAHWGCAADFQAERAKHRREMADFGLGEF